MDEYSKEERAKISKDFRSEITRYGVKQAVYSLMASKSDKVPIRKLVMKQQCRKPNFKKEFDAACENLKKDYPALRQQIKDFKSEILA